MTRKTRIQFTVIGRRMKMTPWAKARVMIQDFNWTDVTKLAKWFTAMHPPKNQQCMFTSNITTAFLQAKNSAKNSDRMIWILACETDIWLVWYTRKSLAICRRPVAVLCCNPQSCQPIFVFAASLSALFCWTTEVYSPIRIELRSIEPNQCYRDIPFQWHTINFLILLEMKGLKFKLWVADPDLPEPIANPQDGVKHHDGNNNDLQTAVICRCEADQHRRTLCCILYSLAKRAGLTNGTVKWSASAVTVMWQRVRLKLSNESPEKGRFAL